MEAKRVPGWKDKVLFTPGPLTTSRTIKQATLRDVGHRDFEFIQMVKDIRKKLLVLAGVADQGYETVLMQGSGTYSVEAVISTALPANGKLMLIINGAYGKRIAKMAQVLKIASVECIYPEDALPDLREIEATLKEDAAITHVAIVHCETTTGLMNPIKEVGEIVKKYGKIYIVDAMSSFGAVPMNLADCYIDYMISSANKNLEGIPGFAYVIVRRDVLLATEGNARSLSLDLLDQWKGLEKNGQFRFSPPTHCILALNQALHELDLEGGVKGRAARYRENYETLVAGMRAMGFKEYLRPELQGYIITSFRYPTDPNFDFEEFYTRLNDKDYVIYPGKVSDADCFRIASCGRIFKNDIRDVLRAIPETITEMGVTLTR